METFLSIRRQTTVTRGDANQCLSFAHAWKALEAAAKARTRFRKSGRQGSQGFSETLTRGNRLKPTSQGVALNQTRQAKRATLGVFEQVRNNKWKSGFPMERS